MPSKALEFLEKAIKSFQNCVRLIESVITSISLREYYNSIKKKKIDNLINHYQQHLNKISAFQRSALEHLIHLNIVRRNETQAKEYLSQLKRKKDLSGG